MSNVVYKEDIYVDEEPNESGIYQFWQHFKAPKDAEGDVDPEWFDDYIREAAASLGVALAEAKVFEVVTPEDSPTLRSYENDLEKPFRLGLKVIPDQSVPDEQMKNLQRENSRLRYRVRALENKLAQVKDALPDDI